MPDRSTPSKQTNGDGAHLREAVNRYRGKDPAGGATPHPSADAVSGSPAAASGSGGRGNLPQRDIRSVAADLAIQQENEGLRLALREQERIVEELTNECRRLEDRLEDRYQDIDALRRELDRGERDKKKTQDSASELASDLSAVAAGASPDDKKTPGKEASGRASAASDGQRGLLGFASGLIAGLVLAAAVVGALWWAEILALTGRTPVEGAETGQAIAMRSPPPPSATSPGAGSGRPAAGGSGADTGTRGAAEGGVDRPLPGANADQAGGVSSAGPADDNQTGEPLESVTSPPVTRPAESELKPAEEPVRGIHADLLGPEGPLGPELIVLNPSQYLMGNPVGMADSDARPVHKVSLDGFMIGSREVTFADYDRFVRETGARRPHDYGWGRGSRPVVGVSWEEAVAYTEWLSRKTGQRYRLPSEAEWEYAARGGTTTSYWWGVGSPASRALCLDCGTRWDQVSTAPVASFPPNPFGLFDTAGNVYEWTADCYHHNYKGAPADGSARNEPGCEYRVVRGGGFKSPAGAMRSHSRNRFAADAEVDMVGFRVARDLDSAEDTSADSISGDDG